MFINQRVVVGRYGFFDYFPEMLQIIQFIKIAFDFSLLCACQFHRIGKDSIAGLFPVKPPCIMLPCVL